MMRTLQSLAAIMRRVLEWRFVRFLLVGVLNTIFGYAIYLVGILLGASPRVALAVATIIGAVFNYFSTGSIVFANSGARKMPLFLAAYLVIYLGNLTALQALIAAGLSAGLAQGLLLPLVAISSFIMFKFIIFRPGFK